MDRPCPSDGSGQAINTPSAPARNAPPLPHLVWDCIASHLSDSLDTLLHLASFSPDLRDICRPYTSPFFETIYYAPTPLLSSFYYHRVLQLVLESYVDPTAIREIYCQAHGEYWPWRIQRPLNDGSRIFVDDTIPGRPRRTTGQVREFEQLVFDAVQTDPFIPADRRQAMLEDFQWTNPDHALALLIPRCTKLKTLEYPLDAPLCAAVVQGIAREYQQRGIKAEEARQYAWDTALRDRHSTSRKQPAVGTLPLSELLIVCYVNRAQYGHLLDFRKIIPFLGIPSLHRVILEQVKEEEDFADLPTDYVPCSCPNIWLQQSDVSEPAIRAFAQLMSEPCEIRQWHAWWPLGHSFVHELEWDTVRVQTRVDGSRDVTLSEEHDGGNPGYEHPWASWLYRGKMRDWRRLDEDFANEEDDIEDMELGGGLGPR